MITLMAECFSHFPEMLYPISGTGSKEKKGRKERLCSYPAGDISVHLW